MGALHLDGTESVLALLDRMPTGVLVETRSLPWVLAHCAQSIEMSMSGYPAMKSGLFRATIGPLAKRRFLSRGAMRHDLVAEIPGAPDLGAPSLDDAVARLRKAIEAFRAHPEDRLSPHFAYGTVTKSEYDRLHAMHVADHLASLATSP